jgi:hypothetical protein
VLNGQEVNVVPSVALVGLRPFNSPMNDARFEAAVRKLYVVEEFVERLRRRSVSSNVALLFGFDVLVDRLNSESIGATCVRTHTEIKPRSHSRL